MHTSLSHLALLRLQIEALYQCDADGRIRATKDPDGAPAPRFFMGRTVEGNLWSTRHDVPDALVRQLDALCQLEPIATDLSQAPVQRDAIRQALEAYEPISADWRGPAYTWREKAHAPAHIIRVSESTRELAQPWFEDTRTLFDDWGPVFVALEHGQAVAVSFSSRLTPQAAEAGVNTLEPFRGRGHAAAAVAAWADAIQQSGRTALYSTSWDNRASQGVARRLGLMQYGDDWNLR